MPLDCLPLGEKMLDSDGHCALSRIRAGALLGRTAIRGGNLKTQFLPYSSPVVVNMVPKRLMNADQQSEFRNLLDQNITPA